MKRFFKILFSFVFILFAVIIVGVVVLVNSFDLNSYKSFAEKIVREATGRQLSLSGDAHLGISLNPSIILEDVTFENPAWAKNKQMVSVKKLEVQIALLPLLEKQIVIEKVLLNEPNINLEISKQGQTSWDFVPLPQDQKPAPKVSSSGWLIKSAYAAPMEEVPAPAEWQISELVAKMVQIQNAKVSFEDEKSGVSENIQINNLELSIPSPNDLISVKLDVVYQDEPFVLSGTIGSIGELLADQVYPINVDLSAYKVNGKVAGNLKHLMTNLAYDVNVALVSPQGNFDAPEIKLASGVKGDLSVVNLDIAQLSVAGNLINGNLQVDIAAQKPKITANLNSDYIDVRSFAQEQKNAFDFSLISSAHAAEYVPQTKIPYESLDIVNAVFNIKVANLVIDDNFKMQNVALQGSLQDGLLNVKPLVFGFVGGTLSSDIMVNAKTQSMSLLTKSNNLKLQDIHKEFQVVNNKDFGIIDGGNTVVYLNLKTKGDNLRRLVENLDGQSVIVLDKSEIQTGNISFFTGNFLTQVLDALHLRQKTVKMDLRCAVVRTDFAQGKAKFPQGIALNATQMSLVSDGYVNLVNDKISFTLQPFSGKVVDTNLAQALGSFLRISGTVEKPTIRLDDKEALRAAVGILATGGTAYLGEKLIINPDGSPCYTALQGTPYAQMFPKPTGVANATRDAYKDTEKEIKKNLKSLENTAKDIFNSFKGQLKNGSK